MTAETPVQTLTRVKKLVASLDAARALWLTEWRDLVKFFDPTKGRFDVSTSPIAPKRESLWSTDGVYALRDLSAGIFTGMCSPSQPWFKESTKDPKLADQTEVRAWLGEVTEVMLNAYSRSNFYPQARTAVEELLCCGAGVLLCEELRGEPVFCALTVGEYWLGCDLYGEVSTLSRVKVMTARQAVERFGDKCSPRVLADAADPARSNNSVKVIHYVGPNTARDPLRLDAKGMEYESVYYEESGERPLEVAGYKEKPFAAPRWKPASGSAYGYGPCYDALPNVKTLNHMEKQGLRALDKTVDPGVIVPKSIYGIANYNLPGVQIPYDPERGTQQIQQLYNVRPDFAALQAMKEEQRTQLRRGMHLDLFYTLAQLDKGQMTQLEVIQRVQEKMTLLGPVVERVTAEFLQPIHDRVFRIIWEKGDIPPPPEQLQGVEITPVYTSPLATLQATATQEQAAAFVSLVASWVAVWPEVADAIDPDKLVDEGAKQRGVPTDILRSQDSRDELRQGRANAQAQAMQAENMAQAAQTMRNLGTTPLGGDNALAGMMEGE